MAQLAASPQVGAAIKSHVDKINSTRPKDIRIRKFAILSSFEQRKGEVTPTGFIRREEVLRNSKKAADALFSPDVGNDLQRLENCANSGEPVLLFNGSTGNEYKSLNELQEKITYWTEDGNDVVRTGRTVRLAGQSTIQIPPDKAIVDADELAIVNMLYDDNAAPMSFYKEDGSEIKISKPNDFPMGVKLLTENGTSVVRSDVQMLLVQNVRQIPLETDGKENKAGLVDSDELAIVNMLYDNGEPVVLFNDGNRVEVTKPNEFQEGILYQTSNGTTVLRKDNVLVIDGQRNIPLELETTEFGEVCCFLFGH